MVAVQFLPRVRIPSVASLMEGSQHLLAQTQGWGSSPPLGAALPGKPPSLDAAETCFSSVSGATVHAALWPQESFVAFPAKNLKRSYW